MSFPRPDEEALASQQKRREENKGYVRKGINTAIGLGTAALGGAGLGLTGLSQAGSKILPFLSENIPFDMAMKGLKKFSPGIADMIQKGMKRGLDPKQGLNFVKDNLMKEKAAQEDRNVVEQESPDLHNYLLSEIKKGRTPIQAAAVATLDKNFKRIIDKLTKAHKTPWGKLIETLYGGAQSEGMGDQPLNEDTLSGFKPSEDLLARRKKGEPINEDTLGILPNPVIKQNQAQSQPTQQLTNQPKTESIQSPVTKFGRPNIGSLAKESSAIPDQFVKQAEQTIASQPQQMNIAPEMQALMDVLNQVKQSRQKRGR